MAEPIFNSAFGGGLRSGSALAQLMQERQQRSQLQQLAQMASQPNVDYQQLGAGFIGAGLPGQGMQAMGIPYQQEQQRLQREFQNQQAADTKAYRNATLGLQREKLISDQRPDAPEGYMWNDLNNPQAGVTAIPGAPTTGGGPFSGKSVEAQSLNYLVRTGELTAAQAAQLGAGKQITGPNGEILFMTPQGIMAKYPNTDAFPYQGGSVDAPGQQEAAASPSIQTQVPPAQHNAIPLTAPKDKTTEKQRNDASVAQAAISSLNTALDDYVKMVGKTGYAVLPGKERDAVLTSRRNIQMQMKELYNLGVLNGPDLELMDQMLFNAAPGIGELPVAAIDGMTPFGTGAAGRSEANAKQLKAQFQDILENRLKAIGRNVDAVGSGKRMRYNAATGQIE